MAALSRITPGFLSKLTTFISSTWLRGTHPSATSQKLLSKGYATDVVVGTWVEGYRESFEPLAKHTGMSDANINKMKNNKLKITYTKSGNNFDVFEQTQSGAKSKYKITKNGYNRKFPLFNINTKCYATYKDDGLFESCMFKHPRSGQAIYITSYRYVDKDLLIEVSEYKGAQMILAFTKA